MNRLQQTMAMLTAVSILFSTSLFAQEEAPTTNPDTGAPAAEKSMEQLAKEMSNPLAQIWNMSFQYNVTQVKADFMADNVLTPGTGDSLHIDGSDNLNTFLFQPVLPIPVKDFMFFVRPVITVIGAPTDANYSSDMDGYHFSGDNREAHMGDIILPMGFGKVVKEGLSWGGGATFIFPTSSNDILGSRQYQAGPTALLLWGGKKTVIGAHYQQWWGFAYDKDMKDLPDSLQDTKKSHMDVQYFIIFNLPKAWAIRSSPHITVDFNAKKGEQLTLPIGVGFSKMIKIGPMPVQLMDEYHYSVISPDPIGSGHEMMLQANFIIKNPFGKL